MSRFPDASLHRLFAYGKYENPLSASADGWGCRLSQDGAPDALSLQADDTVLQRFSGSSSDPISPCYYRGLHNFLHYFGGSLF